MNDTNNVLKDSKHFSLKSFTLPLPFPQRMAKAKLNFQLELFKGPKETLH